MPGSPFSAATIISRRSAKAATMRWTGLRGGVDTRVAVDRKALGMREQDLGPHRVAEPPAGHRIGLAPAVQQDQPVAQRWIAQQADMLGGVIENFAVNLVAKD